MNDEILKGVDGLLCKLSSKDAAANIQQAKAAPTNSNKSMFTAVDIANTDNILTKLIRYFCIKNRITLEDYVNCYNRYGERIGMLPSKISTSRNNLKNTFIGNDAVTWNRLIEVLTVFGHHLVDVKLTMSDDKGNIHEISISDMRRTISSDFPNDIAGLKDIAIGTIDDSGKRHVFKQENSNGETQGVSDSKE